MFHLINKTYLCRDTVIEKVWDWGIISKEKGAVFNPAVKQYFPGEQLFHHRHFDEMGYDAFVDFLFKYRDHPHKIIIYCDEPTYYRLISFWLVNIVTECPTDTRLSMIRSVEVNDTLLDNRPMDDPIGPRMTAINDDYIRALIDTQEPHQKCQEMIVNNWIGQSFEFMIFSYLVSGRINDELRSKVKFFTSRFFNNMAQGIRTHLLGNFYTKRQQEFFEYDSNDLRIGRDPVELLKKMPMFRQLQLQPEVNSVATMSLTSFGKLLKQMRYFYIDYLNYDDVMVNDIFSLYRVIDKHWKDVSRDDINLYIRILGTYAVGFNGLPTDDTRNINMSLLGLIMSIPEDKRREIRLVNHSS